MGCYNYPIIITIAFKAACCSLPIMLLKNVYFYLLVLVVLLDFGPNLA